MKMWVRAVALLLFVPVYSLNLEMAYSEEEDEDANSYVESREDDINSGDASTDTIILAWNHRPEMAKDIEQIKKANAALRDIFGTRILVTGAATTTSTEHVIRYKGKFLHVGEEIEYTTVMMETTKEITEIVETTTKINHSVEYVTDPMRTMICTTNQLSTIKEDDRGAKLPQHQNFGLLEVKPLQTQNTGILKVTSLQTQNTGFLSEVQPHKIKYLDVPLKTSLKMLQTTNSLESSEQTSLINIDVRKFMRLYNYLRKLQLNKLQQTIKEQESLKASASIDGGTSATSNQPAELLSAVRDSVATKQMERSSRVTNVTTVRIPSRRVATSHVGRTLPARRAPDDDLPSAQSLANQKIVAKCYVCGLTSKHIPEDSNCSDAFSRREFLSLEPYDPRVRMQAIRFRRYCKYYHGYPWPFEHPEVPHSIFGEFTEGCSVRWTDAAGAYTQRACRIRRNPMRGNHLASKRMAQLEYLLRHSSEGCIESPMATLLPLTRTISLFARFHACVCKGNWCNAGCETTPQMVAILLCSWFWKLL